MRRSVGCGFIERAQVDPMVLWVPTIEVLSILNKNQWKPKISQIRVYTIEARCREAPVEIDQVRQVDPIRWVSNSEFPNTSKANS